MDYAKFRKLLSEGEKRHIDFKIVCDAFRSQSVAPRGELARDICAMANNGYMASYVIVGVSDDGKQFKSVDNMKLTDDNLQDFCKKAVFPPPKVRVYRKTWKRALATHKGKEFVIIQIGPNRRQVFHLAQDFIDYRAKTCYRRNEVWIRRGATTDLATPEEIIRLASGQSLQETEEDKHRKVNRESFSRLSQHERCHLIIASTSSCLEKLGYKQLPRAEWVKIHALLGDSIYADVETRWKRIDSTAMIVRVLRCLPTLTSKALQQLYWSDAFDAYRLVYWDELPASISRLTRRRVKSVRRLCIAPVLRSVPPNRIEKALPRLRRIGRLLHYYQPSFERRWAKRDRHIPVPSSSELLILGGIKSVSDYEETLVQAIQSTEGESSTIIVPSKR
jgi:hypothetical protein